jgi:hypothetical protein
MNDIAYVEFETVSPLFFDPYTQNRITGSFILIDPISNATLGAGMIRADLSSKAAARASADEPVAVAERYKRHGHAPAMIIVENNEALAARLERVLFDEHFEAVLVSGKNVSASDLGRLYPVLESAGIVLIYSSDALASDTKLKLSAIAASRYLDSSLLELPGDESDAAQKILSRLRSLRS